MIAKYSACAVFETALGWISIAASEHGVSHTSLPEPTPDNAVEQMGDPSPTATAIAADDVLHRARELLIRYCDGEDVSLDGIPIDDAGWSDYTRRARLACRSIPRGETRTYGWLAEQASGSRLSARAAGRAMATNPVPIIVPCHRVIGSDGRLHGFGGSIGLPLKSRLLLMEGALADSLADSGTDH